MTDHAVLPAAGHRADPGTAAPDDDLTSLREILIGPAEAKIDAIQARLDDRFAQARDVAVVLPQALLQRSHDPELARALSPPVERAITASVRRDPRPLADALFPVIGPAIRRAVAASLAAMVESLNRTVEQSVSWRALQWRLEAARTGRPFADIVLLNTLMYRVEQVFLIHRKTGLLLQHVRAGPAQVEDGQLVSAMLTAIRDFVQDSFRVSEQDSLDALKVGELSVWIEQGPAAVIASVIRGTAPPEYRQVLQRTLETTHLQFGGALDAFEGDASVFEAARPLIEECLVSQLRPGTKRRRRGALIVLLVILLAAGAWGGREYRQYRRWTAFVEALRREPGLVVISTERRSGKYVVTGLRDPLARDPGSILQRSRLSPDVVATSWEPYQALQPAFVLPRANAALQTPPGVTLTLDNGVLKAGGEATAAWIADAQRVAPLVAGVSRFDPTAVVNARIHSLTTALQRATLLFVRGRPQFLPGQEDQIRAIAAQARELGALAVAAARPLRLDVVGHTDADGNTTLNVPLSRQRADRVVAAADLQRTPLLSITAVGVGSDEPIVAGAADRDKQRNRSVTFRVADVSASGGRSR